MTSKANKTTTPEQPDYAAAILRVKEWLDRYIEGLPKDDVIQIAKHWLEKYTKLLPKNKRGLNLATDLVCRANWCDTCPVIRKDGELCTNAIAAAYFLTPPPDDAMPSDGESVQTEQPSVDIEELVKRIEDLEFCVTAQFIVMPLKQIRIIQNQIADRVKDRVKAEAETGESK